MIFLTVGTSRYPFDRMLSSVDKILRQINCKEELIAQTGCSLYVFQYKYTKVFHELSHETFHSSITKARIVITHGGMGSLLHCFQYAKNKPFVYIRDKKFKEHIDNHQREISRYLETQEYIVTDSLDTYLRHPKKNIKRALREGILVHKLASYITLR